MSEENRFEVGNRVRLRGTDRKGIDSFEAIAREALSSLSESFKEMK